MIYLASPYSHVDPTVRVFRFEQACIAAGNLMAQGLHVFSPIAHTHPIAVHVELPGDFRYWEKYDREMISLCEELIVLKLDGWGESIGVRAEILIAQQLSRPVSYMEWPMKCFECEGSGRVLDAPQNVLGGSPYWESCDKCGGSGTIK